MPIRCHAEHDGLGIVLSKIDCLADADSLRNFFAESGVGAVVCQPDDAKDYRVFLAGISMAAFGKLIDGSNIDLMA